MVLLRMGLVRRLLVALLMLFVFVCALVVVIPCEIVLLVLLEQLERSKLISSRALWGLLPGKRRWVLLLSFYFLLGRSSVIWLGSSHL